jgi:signal transduction histidine kinase
MLKRIIDNIPLAVWYRDANNTIAYCNEVYAGALEHSKREIIDLSLELIPKDRPLGPYHLSVMAQDGYKMIKERDHAVLSGSRRLLEFGAIPFKNGETVNYAMDLSEVEGLQNILEQLTKSHHEILHNLSTGVSVFGEDTRLLFYNHAYVKIFDFDEEWLATKPTLLEVLDDLRQRRKIPEYSNFQQMKKNRLKLFKTLLQPMYETTHQPSGQVLRMVIAPYLQGGLVYIFEDVSDRIALERQYNTLSAVQRETIDHLYEGIIVIGSDLRLRILNKAAINLLMIKEPEWFLGKNLNEIFFIPESIFSEPRQEFFNQLMVLFEKRHPFQGTLTLKTHIIAQYSYLPLPDGAHLLSMVDITNAKRLETSLKERNNLLSEINLLKSHFIHHVVNELKAPLKSMQYLAEDLEQDDFSHDYSDKQRLYGQEINDMSQHLITMLDEMVTLSQIEAPHTDYTILEDITLDMFLRNMLGLIAWHAEEKSISVKLNNLCRVLTFKGDERRLKQIFFNILQNGVKGARQNSDLHVNVVHEQTGTNHFLVFCVEILPSVTADHSQQDLFDRQIRPQLVDRSEDFGLSLASKFLEMQKGSLTIKQTPSLITLLAKLPIEQYTSFSDGSSKVA